MLHRHVRLYSVTDIMLQIGCCLKALLPKMEGVGLNFTPLRFSFYRKLKAH